MDAGSESGRMSEHKPGALLEVISQELRNRGLEVREYRHGDELVEITVCHPRIEANGRVTVGYDGKVTWEYQGDVETRPGADEIRETIIGVLMNDALWSLQKQRDTDGEDHR